MGNETEATRHFCRFLLKRGINDGSKLGTGQEDWRRKGFKMGVFEVKELIRCEAQG